MVTLLRALVFVSCLTVPLRVCAADLLPMQATELSQSIAKSIDGRTYAVSFGQDGKGEAGKDVICFEGG